jgi:hypothetical protein
LPELASGAQKLIGRAQGWRGEGGQPVTRLTRAREVVMRLGHVDSALWSRHSSVERGEGEQGEVRWRTVGALPFIGGGGGEEAVRRGGGRLVKAEVMAVVKIQPLPGTEEEGQLS